MKLKKVLALVCALALSATAFAGCQNNNTPSSQAPASGGASSGGSASSGGAASQELNVAVFEGGYGSAIWYQLAKDFEAKNPGVTVNITASAQLGDVIRPNLTQQKDVPDFIYLASTNASGILQSLIGSDQLVELSDVFDAELKGKMIEGALDGPTFQPKGDGKIYSAPLFYSPYGLWYDANLFKTNNWEAPKTWDDFYALGDKAKEKGLGLITYAAANAPGYLESVVWPTIANANNDQQALSDIFTYKADAWKSDSVSKMLGVFQTIKDKGYLLEGTLGMNHTQSQQQLLLDKVLFLPCGSWLEGEMKSTEKAEGFEYGFAGLPTFDASQDKPFAWGASEEMYIPKAAKNQELAKKFMKYLYSDDAIKVLGPVAGAIPPIEGAVELVKEKLDPSVVLAYNSMSEGYRPIGGGFSATDKTELNIRRDFFQEITKMLAGETTADALVAKMEDEAKQLAEIVIK